VIDKRIASLAIALALLLSTAGSTFAMPADGSVPKKQTPGLATKTFVHYDKDRARTSLSLQASAAATVEKPCATSGSPTCSTFAYGGVHWKVGSRVVYFIDMNFSTSKSPTLTQSAAMAAIYGSFRVWGAAMPAAGGITFVYGGTTRVAPGRPDLRNVVGWGSLPSGTLAVTTVWYLASTGQILEADVTLNNSYSWAYTPPTGCTITNVSCNPGPAGPARTYDVRNVATHEVGHTLMLGDLYSWSNRGLTMYGYASPNQRAKDSLGTGDRLGVRSAY